MSKERLIPVFVISLLLLSSVVSAAGTISITDITIPSSVTQADSFTITMYVSGSQVTDVYGSLTLPSGISCTPTASQFISLGASGTGSASWSCTADVAGDYTNRITASVTAKDSGTGASLSDSRQTGLKVLSPASLIVSSGLTSNVYTVGINNIGDISTTYTVTINCPSGLSCSNTTATSSTISGISLVNVKFSLSGTAGHSYTVNATVEGGNGQTLTAPSKTYTVPTEEEEAAPSPGLGAPPGTTVGTTPGKAVIYIPSIAAAAKANVTIQKTEGVDFMEISITVVNKVTSVYLTITKLDAKPTETPALVNVYRYIKIVPENIEDGDISEAKIKFKVNKSWISANNIDEDSIALQRYANNKWNKLTTTKLSEDTEFVYYEAEVPGFSYFAITGEEKVAPVCGNDICETGEDYSNCPADCPAPCVEDWTCTEWSECVDNKQTRTCTDENNCGSTVNKPTEEQTCEVAPTVPAELIAGIVVIVILVLGVLFWKGLKTKRKI